MLGAFLKNPNAIGIPQVCLVVNLHVSRVKGWAASAHPLSGRELRALRRLKREQNPPSPFVFTSERGALFAIRGFGAMVARLGEAAGSSTGCIRSCGMPAATCWPITGRYPHAAGLSRSPEHPAHGALHEIVGEQVQEPVARLIVTPSGSNKSFRR